jgi:hypothetical protein
MITNPFTAVDQLPADFHEVHGHRPARFRDHAAASAWLARMETATLTSATNLLAIADRSREAELVRQAQQYLAVHQAIVALRRDGHR